MENQIEDLLGEISKFKSNISNSNELLELLEKIYQDIDTYKDRLEEEHTILTDRFQKSMENINNSIESLDSANKENHFAISRIENMLQNAHINKLFWIILGLFLSILVNSVLLIIILIIK